MYVVATAGHVDHGKSALVRALTGIDPDRWEEERRRGMTIDLGYAWLSLPSGREVALVDVPGHERFIKNMLAGAGAVNAALFIVAANEGWMPQTQEHLDILHLLEISTAVVAITKTDLAEPDALAALREEVSRRIGGTLLRDSPIVDVSAITGHGVEDLIKHLDAALDPRSQAPDRGRARLWIDRVFSMKGAGTVVTGTLIGGSLKVEDEVEIHPTRIRTRVRAMQSHQRKVSAAGPGSRVALNLTTVETDDIARGHVVGLPGEWAASHTIAAAITPIVESDREALRRGAFKLHVGSAETQVSIRVLEDQDPPVAIIRADDALVFDVSDRFVLRDVGRRATVAGGVVLDPHFQRPQRRATDLYGRLVEVKDRPSYVAYFLQAHGPRTIDELQLKSGSDGSGIPGIEILRGWAMTSDHLDALRSKAEELVRSHQEAKPVEPGMPRTKLRSSLGLEERLFDAVVEELTARGVLTPDGAAIRTPDFSPQTGGPEREALLRELRAAGTSPPTMKELYNRFDPAQVRSLLATNELVQITPEIAYLKTALDGMRSKVIEHLGRVGPMTVAEFRDLVGTTRKYAVPLLEHFDRIGVTRRDGDVRTLGPRAAQEDG